MYFRLLATLTLVKIAQIVLKCFTRVTARTIKALLRGVVVRDIVTIRWGYAPTMQVSREQMSPLPPPASVALVQDPTRTRCVKCNSRPSSWECNPYPMTFGIQVRHVADWGMRPRLHSSHLYLTSPFSVLVRYYIDRALRPRRGATDDLYRVSLILYRLSYETKCQGIHEFLYTGSIL